MNRNEPRLAFVDAHQPVWRVGYLPQPWAVSGWQYATVGRFTDRWEDRDGNLRTTYAGSTLLGCLLETLAHFRPDPALAAALCRARLTTRSDRRLLRPVIGGHQRIGASVGDFGTWRLAGEQHHCDFSLMSLTAPTTIT